MLSVKSNGTVPSKFWRLFQVTSSLPWIEDKICKNMTMDANSNIVENLPTDEEQLKKCLKIVILTKYQLNVNCVWNHFNHT